jgi:hypothetical protein
MKPLQGHEDTKSRLVNEPTLQKHFSQSNKPHIDNLIGYQPTNKKQKSERGVYYEEHYY